MIDGLLTIDAVEGLPDNVPTMVMGLTFGLYHLIYAACTWSRKRDAGEQPVDE